MDEIFDRFSKLIEQTDNKLLKAAVSELSKKLARLPHSKDGISALLSCSLVKLSYTDNDNRVFAVCTSVPEIVKKFSAIKRNGGKKDIFKTNKSFGVITYDMVSGRKIYIDISKPWHIIMFIPLYDEHAKLIIENTKLLEQCVLAYSKLPKKTKTEDVFV